jgi:hypothetical protein
LCAFLKEKVTSLLAHTKVKGVLSHFHSLYSDKHLLLSSQQRGSADGIIILSPVCSAAGFVVHGRRGARVPLARVADEAAGALRWMLRASLFDLLL